MKTHKKYIKSKIWPLQPRKWPLDLEDLGRGSVNFSKKYIFINQSKALRKNNYNSAFSSNFENYQILTLRPRGHQESVEIWCIPMKKMRYVTALWSKFSLNLSTEEVWPFAKKFRKSNCLCNYCTKGRYIYKIVCSLVSNVCISFVRLCS